VLVVERLRGFCAVVLVILAISPITAPFCSYDLADLPGTAHSSASLKLKLSSSHDEALAAPLSASFTAAFIVERPRPLAVDRPAAPPSFLGLVLRL
jgi:hypothetical protein